MGLDPVCGTEVNTMSAAVQCEYGGQAFYFCSEACRQRFLEAPERYLNETDHAQARLPRAS
jgi:Cu+-exporting ATPase